jgi:hypothetical protein
MLGLLALTAPIGSAAARPDRGLVTTADDSLVIGAVGDMACDPANRHSTQEPQPSVFLQRFGYLRTTLGSSGWSAEFIDSSGVVADSSSGTCHT